ncbi:MAG: arabinooligosaccharide transport system substrate-binding protein [Phycisphaerales bacterium]|jgi:arabinosaccharide transport system substrate-binding protein|nr:arabinooligosaccharide transport system substrate-binding protein [Phycisphaerales bacterium]
MSFHLGKPILVMLIIALVAGAVVAVRPNERKADLTLWVFADSHYKAYKPLIPEFERKHNCTVNLNVLSARALAIRLTSLFMSGEKNEETPDLVEMEIGLIGRFFRPPVADIGFRPLNDRLAESGLDQRIVKTRFAPWSKEGQIFGVPHDLHPCVIVYREDLFHEAGVDLTQAKTWPQYHAACLKFRDYWVARGYKTRHALELPESSSDYLQVMLLQRGINPIDSYGNIYLEDPRVAETLAFYAQLVAGNKKVTAQSSQGIGAFMKDVTEGSLCSFVTPDWRVTYIKRYGAAVSGKMRLMPMPVFDPSDAPTSTWGGTMMGITKACENPDLAWKLMEHLYFSKPGMKARQESSEILPPITTMWNEPVYHAPDPYFGNQKASELYIELAPKIPARYVTFASQVATLELNQALVRATEYVKAHKDDLDERELEGNCRKWLATSAADLRRRMDQWRFD